MAIEMIRLRPRDLRSGSVLSLELAASGAGAGRFLVGPGSPRNGFSLSSPLGDAVLLAAFSLDENRLALTAAADIAILELDLFVDAGAAGLRGWADTPAGARLQISTNYDRANLVDQSSWWVLFGAEPAADGAAKAGPARKSPQ